MSANAILAAVAVGVFLLLCAVSWYLVLALKQLRQTALAMEQFLVTTRPRVEVAAEKLGLLLGRGDRLMASLEGRSGAVGTFGVICQAISGWTAGAQALSTISAAITAIMQAWTTMNQSRQTAETSQS